MHQLVDDCMCLTEIAIVLCDGKLPGALTFWWLPDSPLHLVIALQGPKKLFTPPMGWVDHLITWNHALCGGISRAVGLIHVRAHLSMNFPSGTLPLPPRCSLMLTMITTVGWETRSCALASSVASCCHEIMTLDMACWWAARLPYPLHLFGHPVFGFALTSMSLIFLPHLRSLTLPFGIYPSQLTPFSNSETLKGSGDGLCVKNDHVIPEAMLKTSKGNADDLTIVYSGAPHACKIVLIPPEDTEKSLGGMDEGRSRMSYDGGQGKKTPEAVPKTSEASGDGIQDRKIVGPILDAMYKTLEGNQ
jgi:hypothetical protein